MENLRPAMLVTALRDEKKDYHVGFTKSVGLIKKLVDKTIYPFLNNKNAALMWTFLENKFQHISRMSIMRIFREACNIKFSDCKDVMDYTGCYQAAFDKIQSLITKGLWISKKTIQIALQRSLFRHLEKDYSVLVSAIETVWKNKTTNLSDTILRVTRYTKINKGNKEDSIPNAKILAVNIYRVPKRTCITKKCVE